MRLQQYINEEKTEDLQAFVNMIKSDCKPFLREMKKANRFLFRGYDAEDSYGSDKTNIIYYKKKPRKDRKPKDMYPNTHKKLDDLFNEKFGWRARSNGVFCTGDRGTAAAYGSSHIVFPIGQFRFVWSPKIGDLYTEIRKHISSRPGKSSVPDLEKIVDTYTDKDLAKAIKQMHEISLKCKEYYLVNYYSLYNITTHPIEFFEMLVK